MAKLLALPHQAIISGFRGVIDFYVHDGVPCARKWPRSPGHRRAPAVEAQWAAFTYSVQIWKTLSPTVRQAYENIGKPPYNRAIDFFTKSYISGLDYNLNAGSPDG